MNLIQSNQKYSKFNSPEIVERRIFMIRGNKVMLDADLAELYMVSTKVLNQAVKRNRVRFPLDFMFQLTDEEVGILNRSQIVTGTQKHRDPKFFPYVFTEHGVAMLSSVLRSKTAVEMNIIIIRAFIHLRSPKRPSADKSAQGREGDLRSTK